MAEHNLLGKEGEDLAADYLNRNGYVIRHRNWRFRHLELDIVAEKDGLLVVVEVKTRRNEDFGLPEDAVDDKKIRRTVSATESYIEKNDVGLPVRFDVICIVGTRPPFQIEHIEDAFLPPVW